MRMRAISWFLVGLNFFLIINSHRWTPYLSSISPSYAWIGLGLALAVWSLLIYSGCEQTFDEVILTGVPPKLIRLTRVGLIALLVQYSLGFASSQIHAGIACPSIPGCTDSSFFPSPLNLLNGIAFAHRAWGTLLIGLFGHIALLTARSTPEIAGPARNLFGLSMAQILLGVGVIMSQLDPGSRLLHSAIGYTLWGLLLYVAIRSGALPGQTRQERLAQSEN